MLFKIAWRNIWRNPTRSIVVIISLLIGIWATVFILAVSDSLHAESLKEAIEYKHGHIQIHSKAYKQRERLGNTIPGAQILLSEIRNQQIVKAVTARAITSGMVASAGYSSNIRIVGVVPETEQQTTSLKFRLTDGGYFDKNTKNPIILGGKLAEKLNVSPGNKVIVTFETPAQNLVSTTFRVSGTYAATHVRDEETIVYMDLEDLTRLAGIQGKVNEIVIKLEQQKEINEFVDDLQKRIGSDIVVESWRDAIPELDMLSNMIYQTDIIVTVIVLLALAFGIINTMLMAVLERFKELGVLMAIGMNKMRIFIMILLETALLSLAGGIGGMIIGFVTVQIMGYTGINLGLFSEGLAGWGFKDLVYPELELRVFGIITIAVIATSILASIYPAVRALAMDPSEAIRKEI